MRTTISLDDALLELARRKALEEKISFARFVEDSVREKIAREERSADQEKRPLVTWKGNGLLPGVDPYDSRGLLDHMDGNK
jgi:hypothetical protein